MRAREARKGLHKDLEGLFGVLRRGDSSASNSGSLVKAPSVTSSLNPVSPMTSLLSRISSTSSTHSVGSSPKTAVVKPITKPPIKNKQGVKVKASPKTNLKQINKPKKNSVKSNIIAKYRHLVPDSEFILKKRNLSTRWSKWNLALSSEKQGSGRNWVERKNKVGYRRKTLFPTSDYAGSSLYEIAVQRSKGCKLFVMQAKWCLVKPKEEKWEAKLFRQKKVKDILEKVLSNGGKVFIRRFVRKGLGLKQKDLVKSYNTNKLYRYAWTCGLTNPGKLSWAM